MVTYKNSAGYIKASKKESSLGTPTLKVCHRFTPSLLSFPFSLVLDSFFAMQDISAYLTEECNCCKLRFHRDQLRDHRNICLRTCTYPKCRVVLTRKSDRFRHEDRFCAMLFFLVGCSLILFYFTSRLHCPECPVDSDAFKMWINLQEHLVTVHNLVRVICIQCGEVYVTKASIMKFWLRFDIWLS